jgi:hypothetical protein
LSIDSVSASIAGVVIGKKRRTARFDRIAIGGTVGS